MKPAMRQGQTDPRRNTPAHLRRRGGSFDPLPPPKLTDVQRAMLSAYDRLGPMDDVEDWSILVRETGSLRSCVSRTVKSLIGLGMLRALTANNLRRRNVSAITTQGRAVLSLPQGSAAG